MTNRDRIITPTSDPDRWTDEERELFDAGKCSWLTAYGDGRRTQYCGQTSKPGASFGNCEEHNAELLESFHSDGSWKPWRNTDGMTIDELIEALS